MKIVHEIPKQEIQQTYVFEEIVAEYRERLYWHIRKIVLIHDDADDILQNTFIKIWKNLSGFKGESKIYTWLYRIATNEAITFINKRKNEHKDSLVGYEEYLKNKLESDEYFDGDELQLQLQKAILTLPEKQRIVFLMRYYDEIKYSEMSEILDTSEGALKASYHHAVKKIEEYFVNI